MFTQKSNGQPGYRSWFNFSIEHDVAYELRSFVKMAAHATAVRARDSKHQSNLRRKKSAAGSEKLMWR